VTGAPHVVAAFVRRDWQEQTSYRFPFVLDLFTAAFSLTLFFFIGQLFDEALTPGDPDLAEGYFTYVLFGYAVFGLGDAVLGSLPDRIRGEQTEGTLEALMATSSPAPLLVLAGGAYDVLYAAARAVILIVAGVLVYGATVDATPASFAAAVVASACVVLFFAALGILAAAFTMVFKQASTVAGMLGAGVALLSGVYFPVAELPPFLQAVGELLPLTWALDVVRAGTLRAEVDVVQLALVVVAGLLAIPLAMPVYLRSIRRAKREGSLVEY
jgi:ABC-type multidrug transport system permease subunit